jgi:hypothetical protein
MATRKNAKNLPPPDLKEIDDWSADGFDTIDDSFGEEWDVEAKDTITGTVIGEPRAFTANKGRIDEHVWRAVNIADDEDGVVYTVRESASLRPWFDKLEEGSRVRIKFRGYQDIGKPSPMKVFQAGVQPAGANARRPAASGRARR